MTKRLATHDTPEIEAYYDHAEALRFVEECERAGIRILGMDFLRRETERHAYEGTGWTSTGWTTRSVTPVNSTAWPDDITPDESWRDARLLLRDGIPNGGNVVSFTTDDPSG